VVLGTSVGSSNETPVTVAGGEFTSCLQLADIVWSAGVKGYDDTPNNGGEYKVWVSNIATFDNNATKTDNFKVREGGCVTDCTPLQSLLTIQKFYDANTDGVKQAGEPFLTGWRVGLTPSGQLEEILHTTYTADRNYGQYSATEFMPIQTNWIRTTPAVIPVSFVHGSDGTTITFGNVCTGAGGGLTLGYWSNKNGQDDLTKAVGGMSGSLARLTGLNLRTPEGTPFDPTSYAQYRTWLLNGNAVNMAYMLSVQLSAMSNNVATGKVSGSALIYAPGATGANGAGFASIQAVMTEANASLGTSGLTTTADPVRTYQEALKNALDNANNNRNFAQAQPCTFTFPTL
jgi:hypothetical protein